MQFQLPLGLVLNVMLDCVILSCVVTCKKLCLLYVADKVSQKEAADLSALFDVGGIVGMFISCRVVASICLSKS